jgi:hypothetical protein
MAGGAGCDRGRDHPQRPPRRRARVARHSQMLGRQLLVLLFSAIGTAWAGLDGAEVVAGLI